MRHPVTALLLLSFIMISLSGCSTRQVVDKLSGSTAQRLVTHSIDTLLNELPEAPLNQLHQKKVFLKGHFIRHDPMLQYATARLRAEINARHQVEWVNEESAADLVVDAFFTSLGTDQDSFGLSLPVPTTTTESNDIARIDVIALNMYHGVSELYFYIRNPLSQQTVRSERYKAQIRTDKLALPIITIPISTLK